MPKYVVAGCRQGYGMDADKFYNTVEEYEAVDHEEAKSMASKDGIWVERCTLADEETLTRR